jgi:hypothetical protein
MGESNPRFILEGDADWPLSECAVRQAGVEPACRHSISVPPSPSGSWRGGAGTGTRTPSGCLEGSGADPYAIPARCGRGESNSWPSRWRRDGLPLTYVRLGTPGRTRTRDDPAFDAPCSVHLSYGGLTCCTPEVGHGMPCPYGAWRPWADSNGRPSLRRAVLSPPELQGRGRSEGNRTPEVQTDTDFTDRLP